MSQSVFIKCRWLSYDKSQKPCMLVNFELIEYENFFFELIII